MENGLAALEALRPHISRASLLTAKLRFERAKAAVEAFGLAAIPAAIVKADATVVAANEQFVALKRQLAIGAGDRLRLGFAGAAGLLQAALSRRSDSSGRRPPLSIAVPAVGETAPLVVHVLPTEGAARDIFGAGTALLIVTRLDGRSPPETGLLRALFDLTPMEAKVAQAIVGGRESAEIAAALRIGPETLRTHVRALFRKTGFGRRIDLVRFLAPLSALAAEAIDDQV